MEGRRGADVQKKKNRLTANVGHKNHLRSVPQDN